MKKIIAVLGLGFIACAIYFCLHLDHPGELQKWDCSVVLGDNEDLTNEEMITYSDKNMITSTGTLTFQNRNDFDIVVYLFSDGASERTIEIPAGGISIQNEIKKDVSYSVGCYAAVERGVKIGLVVYEGAETDVHQ